MNDITLEQRMDAIKALTAAIMKQIEEMKQALRGEPVNDIPVEAFLPEGKETIL